MKTIVLLLLPSIVLANGPKYTYPEPRGLNDEMQNVYHDITNATVSPSILGVPSFTLSQLQTTTPRFAGQLFYCSNCTTDAVCVSTGTSAFAISRVSARTTSCQ